MHVIDKIQHLSQQLNEIQTEKAEIEMVLKDDADYQVSELKKQHKATINFMSEDLEQSNLRCEILNSNLRSLFDQLCKSEAFISKSIKAIKQQDAAKESAERFHEQSQAMLVDYYNEKLRLCYDQIRLRDKPKTVTVAIQTDQASNLITDELLIDNKELTVTKEVKNRYQSLYKQSIDDLDMALKECDKLHKNSIVIKK